jgi:hypothetical protein
MSRGSSSLRTCPWPGASSSASEDRPDASPTVPGRRSGAFQVTFPAPLRISGLVLPLHRDSRLPERFRVEGRTAAAAAARARGSTRRTHCCSSTACWPIPGALRWASTSRAARSPGSPSGSRRAGRASKAGGCRRSRCGCRSCAGVRVARAVAPRLRRTDTTGRCGSPHTLR